MKLFGQGKYEKAEFANGIGEEARFNQPCQGVFDEDGNLYVSDRDNNCIRKITPDGNVTIYAGNRSEGLVNGLPLKIVFQTSGRLNPVRKTGSFM
ncbi:hypothetical protein NXV57_19235 [Bacteroides thetaiotaomicron]|nr:hypothetical protein [Bacteroides thetaiotaomicron]